MSLPQVTVMSDRDPESFVVRIILAEGTKTRLVLGRKIQKSLVFYRYICLLVVLF